jgi:hypothetical protein
MPHYSAYQGLRANLRVPLFPARPRTFGRPTRQHCGGRRCDGCAGARVAAAAAHHHRPRSREGAVECGSERSRKAAPPLAGDTARAGDGGSKGPLIIRAWQYSLMEMKTAAARCCKQQTLEQMCLSLLLMMHHPCLEHLLTLREQAWRGDVLWLLAKKSERTRLEGTASTTLRVCGLGWDGHDPGLSSEILGYRTHPGHAPTLCACQWGVRLQALTTSGDPRRPQRELHRLISALKVAHGFFVLDRTPRAFV